MPNVLLHILLYYSIAVRYYAWEVVRGIGMKWNLLFFFNSLLLGVGLAMDAFSVSLANGLNEPKMKRNRMCVIAGTFGFFQALMPMTGWFLVHTLVEYFRFFERFVPWIALFLLLFIGGQMLYDGVKKEKEAESVKTDGKTLFLQGIATSIDALSVGFTIAEYGFLMALVCSLLIAAVTFVICIMGLVLGKRFGVRLSDKAEILGGLILIFIGFEIFLGGIL